MAENKSPKNQKSTTDVDTKVQATSYSEKKDIVEPEYTEAEKAHRSTLISLCERSRSEREKPRQEFDDMKYSHYYDTNRRADLGYLPKKVNKEDRRVSTGLTREKDNTLLSVLLKFNFEPFIFAFDQDSVLQNELGKELSDLVKKSREIEEYEEKKRYFIYREFCSQGDVFVEEIVETPLEVRKNITSKEGVKWSPGMPIESFKGNVSFDYVKGLPKPESRLMEGKKVYLGDYSKENISDQPYIFTYEVVTRIEAESIYGKWDRWKNVPMSAEMLTAGTSADSIGNWSLEKVEQDKVGILKFQRKGTNEYQIMLNGVLMLPMGYPLTEVSPSGEYTISQGKFEGITHFSYSKSNPAKTKFDEDTLNKFYKLMILKMEQSLKPPMGNKTGKTIDQSMFLPGKIVDNVSPKQLFPLLTSAGVTSGEFSFFNLVKQSIEDKTINRTFSGQTQEGSPTATQIIEEKQQQMLRLGLALDGIIALEKTMVWKRIYSIINKYTSPIEPEKEVEEMGENGESLKKKLSAIYRTFTYETEIDGKNGVKIFHFTKDKFPGKRQLQKLEQDLEKEYEKPVSVVLLDPELLKQFKGVFRVSIAPTEKNNGDYEALVFLSLVRESYELFGGPESHNMPYIQQRFANIKGIDANRWFVNKQMVPMAQQLAMGKDNKPIKTVNTKTRNKPPVQKGAGL